MQSDDAIHRGNLSAAVGNAIRGMIFAGRLPEGTRLNEVHLARELGVSRTPLREALAGLEFEGALRSEPRRGYFVRRLSAEEFENLYPIRGLLDPAALRLAGVPADDRFDELDALNLEIGAAADVDRRIDLDDRWHLALLADCGNPVLLDLVRDFMRRTRRYELAYLRDSRYLSAATNEHLEITSALRNDDLDAACDALRRNLTSGAEPIRQWLKERTTP